MASDPNNPITTDTDGDLWLNSSGASGSALQKLAEMLAKLRADSYNVTDWEVYPDGAGGYELKITTTSLDEDNPETRVFLQSIPPASEDADGIMTSGMWSLLNSLRVKDVQPMAGHPDGITVTYVDGSTQDIRIEGQRIRLRKAAAGSALDDYISSSPAAMRPGAESTFDSSYWQNGAAGFDFADLGENDLIYAADDPANGAAGWFAVAKSVDHAGLSAELVILSNAGNSGGPGGDFVLKTGDTMTGDLTSLDCSLAQRNATATNEGRIYAQENTDALGAKFASQWIEGAAQVIQATGGDGIAWEDNSPGGGLGWVADETLWGGAANGFQIGVVSSSPGISVDNNNGDNLGGAISEPPYLKASVTDTTDSSSVKTARLSFYVTNPFDMQTSPIFVGQRAEISFSSAIYSNFNTGRSDTASVRFGVIAQDGAEWASESNVFSTGANAQAEHGTVYVENPDGSPVNKAISAFFIEFDYTPNYFTDLRVYTSFVDGKGYFSIGIPDGGGGDPSPERTGFTQDISNLAGNTRIKSYTGDVDVRTPEGSLWIDRYVLRRPSVLSPARIEADETQSIDLAAIDRPLVVINCRTSPCGNLPINNDIDIAHSSLESEHEGRHWEFRVVQHLVSNTLSDNYIYINGARAVDADLKARRFRVDVVRDSKGIKRLQFAHYKHTPLDGPSAPPGPPPMPATVTLSIIQPSNGAITVKDQNNNAVNDGATIPNDGTVTLTFTWSGSSWDFVMWTGNLQGETDNPHSFAVNNLYGSSFSVGALIEPVINIANESDFNNFKNAINNGTQVGAYDGTNGGEGYIFRQTAGWSFNSSSPVGTEARPFKGTYDGKNFALSNFYLTISGGPAGLFGAASHALIKNVIINSGGITYIGGSGFPDYFGGICGHATAGTIIKNCFSNSYLTIDWPQANGIGWGGIAGMLEDSEAIGCATGNSATLGYIDGTINKAGGIAGIVRRSKVLNCWAANIVKAVDYVGGIAGILEGMSGQIASVKDCLSINQAVQKTQTQFSGGVGKIAGETDSHSLLATNVSNSGTQTWGGVNFPGGNLDGTNESKSSMNSNPTVGGRFTQAGGFTVPASGSSQIAGIGSPFALPNWLV